MKRNQGTQWQSKEHGCQNPNCHKIPQKVKQLAKMFGSTSFPTSCLVSEY